ncbi:MAG: chemotaxis protein CheA [Acidobacteriota bacterium]|nr:chemotaxis protein CheA [Acidobacteriota bacterium]
MTVRKKRTRKASSPALPPATFDDALALLIQLEPSDMSGFKRLSDTLQSVIAGGSLDQGIVRLIGEAREQIDRLVQGETTDVEDVLVETSRLLELASNAREASVFHAEPMECPMPKASEATPEPEQTQPDPSVDTAPAAPAKTEIPDLTEESEASDALPVDADPDLLKEFIAESRELLEKSEAALLALENNPDDAESVNTVFRAFHTVKGTSGFLGLKSISELAHHAESLLSRIRNKEIRLIGGYADLALRSLDMLKKAVASVEEALRGAPLLVPDGYAELQSVLANPEAAGISEEITAVELPEKEAAEASGDSGVELEAVRMEPQVDPPVAAAAKGNEAREIPKKQIAPQREGEFEASIRVNTARLDKLINMVGELVIAQSMVAQDHHLMEESCHDLLRKVTQAGKIVRELQDLSMSMRMVPLRGVFQKMQRVARDLSRKSGKSVELVTDDGETEIDRHMVDILNDVLVHMVRNAIDHGIEPQEEREAAGKSRTGTVKLAAFHSGGSVVVEIRDDGRGLNREKILRKAIAAGLVDPEKSLSDNEVYNLIFAPGLSTSETITDVSGRGVGMDVVRQGVESLHGRIEINTAPGAGSTFTVRLPLTLAITDGMLVRVGTERYIIPTISIHLCFRPTPDSLSTVAGRGELVMLRGELMPIFRLHRLFGIRSAIEDPAQGLLVVVGDEERRCALLVDELLGQQQVVAKSLNQAVGKIPGVSGGAILGDGQVGLILDTSEVTAQARKAPGLYRLGAQANSTAA